MEVLTSINEVRKSLWRQKLHLETQEKCTKEIMGDWDLKSKTSYKQNYLYSDSVPEEKEEHMLSVFIEKFETQIQEDLELLKQLKERFN
ncbi:hypothetical protein [Spongiimicrobium salis]|uniref:hypothetical protein n=1 Tax=Spongiimicrobium salis TaxID=1667022 RepID=UPI00374D2E23